MTDSYVYNQPNFSGQVVYEPPAGLAQNQNGEYFPEKEPMLGTELPILDKSETATWLKQSELSPQGLAPVEFKQLICAMILKVANYPHNAPIALNLSKTLPITLIRTRLKQKFRQIDACFHLCCTPPNPQECATLPTLRDSSWIDIVSHYTKYVLISNTNEAPRYIRGKVMGDNNNLKQVIEGISDIFTSDSEQYLTTNAQNLKAEDIDLLCCRFYAMCEVLTISDATAELLAVDDKSWGMGSICRYLRSFVEHLIRLDQEKQHTGFVGLTSDHIKLLLAGAVVLSQGLSKSRAISRLVIYPERDCIRTAEKRITDNFFKQHGFVHDCFRLVRFVVDMTPEVPHYAEGIIDSLEAFLVHQRQH